MNMPIIKIEINDLKHGIMHVLADRNNEINEQIKKTIDETLTEEWILESIKFNVDQAIRKAIDSFSDDHHIRDAIKDCIGQVVVDALEKSVKGEHNEI